MRDGPQWLRAVYVAVGVTGMVATVCASVLLPRHALRAITGGDINSDKAVDGAPLSAHVDASNSSSPPTTTKVVRPAAAAPVHDVENPTSRTPEVSYRRSSKRCLPP
jgi:hypothetical protein